MPEQNTDSLRESAPDRPGWVSRLARYAPGVLLSLAAATAALTVRAFLPGVSPLIVAIVLGIVLTNVVRLPDAFGAGLTFSSKKLLRVGIVLLGLQLVLSDIVALGLPTLAVIVVIVAGGILGTVLMGRMLKMKRSLTLLIACGFSICGAAAVAAVEGSADADEEDVVTAIALVVIFGTIMIPVIPLVGPLLGMAPELTGMWAGGAVHEVAQVVAAGGIIGGGALAVAVIVKLARVLLLAPVIAVLSLIQRRSVGAAADAGGKLPPIVPLFVAGFLAMIALRSTVRLPPVILDSGVFVQSALLSAAMFALGCGVKIRNLVRVGLRPFVLAAASTALVSALAYTGISLTHL